jgi:DNA-binding CsgD family transcriptional regulator/tetratricopeptide (TPR) repeat protein
VPLEESNSLGKMKGYLADCAAAKGRLVMVSGGLASGKSQLLQDFSRHASESGALVLWATGSWAELDLQVGVVEQLFHNSALPAEILDRVSRIVTIDVLVPKDAVPGGPTACPPADVRVLLELSGVLLDLCRQQPVVICVDDMHFADRASLQILLYLQRRIRSRRMLLVLAEREHCAPAATLLRAEMTRQPHERVRLAPLTEQAIAAIAAPVLGAGPATRLSPALRELSGGNPLLARALVQDYRDAAAWGTATGLVAGKAYSAAVLACLQRWEPQIFDLACGLAILGGHASPELLSGLLEVEQDCGVQALEVMGSAGLLSGGRFRHPAAETAVLGGMPAERRVALHLRAAELLYGSVPAAVVADHLVAAGQVSPGWLVGVLRDAAAQALSQDDTDAAGRYLELALTACDDEQERVAIRRELIEATWRVNPAATVLYRKQQERALSSGRLTDRDAATLVKLALWDGDGDAVAAGLDTLRSSGTSPDGQISAELTFALQLFYGPAYLRFWDPGESPDAAAGDPRTSDAANLARIWRHGGDAASAVTAGHILRSCRLGETPVEAVISALLALAYGDQPEDAAVRCAALRAEVSRRGAVTWQAVLGAVHAEISLRAGDPAAAAEQAAEALALLPVQGWGVLIGYPLTSLLLAYTAMGRLDDAAEVLRHAVPDAAFRTVIGVRYLHARGHYYLATDRVLAALDDFQACESLMRTWGLDVPVLVPSRASMAEAYLRLGRTTEACDLASQQLKQQPATDQRTRGVLLQVLASVQGRARREQLLAEAIGCLRASGDRLAVANAEAELCRARQLPGGPQLAPAAAGNHPVFSDPVLSDPVLSDPVLSDSVLSDAEGRVAELAVRGYTNREIGLELWITVSTVEQHLTRVYRKLGVSGRGGLAPGLRRRDVADQAAPA